MFITKFTLINLVLPYVSALSPLLTPKSVTDGFGLSMHFTHPNASEMEMIKAANFKYVRTDFVWKNIEKVKGHYDFADYEYLMTQVKKNDMSAIFILDYGNKLYENYEFSVTTDAGRKAYAQWAATAVDHFKNQGILWEIWQEPNWYWDTGKGFGHQNVTQYIAMALEAVKAIRAKAPNEILMGPSTSLVELDFMEACFKEGLLNYLDAVTAHPYRTTIPETITSDYNSMRNLIAKYAPKGKTIPIVSDEWGYSFCNRHCPKGGETWNSSEPIDQAKYLPRQFLTNIMNHIPISIWYEWHNDGTNQTEPEQNFGLVVYDYHSGQNPVYKPKDVYYVAEEMNAFLNGYHYVKRIATTDHNDYVLLFSNGNENSSRLAAWTTSAQSHQIELPSDDCNFSRTHYNSTGNLLETYSGGEIGKNGSVTLTLNDFISLFQALGRNQALLNAPSI
jgi:hypothetical protein